MYLPRGPAFPEWTRAEATWSEILQRVSRDSEELKIKTFLSSGGHLTRSEMQASKWFMQGRLESVEIVFSILRSTWITAWQAWDTVVEWTGFLGSKRDLGMKKWHHCQCQNLEQPSRFSRLAEKFWYSRKDGMDLRGSARRLRQINRTHSSKVAFMCDGWQRSKKRRRPYRTVSYASPWQKAKKICISDLKTISAHS